MDKTSQHLEDVQDDMEEIERGCCLRLCCSAKRKKRKSKKIVREKSEENIIEYQTDPIYSHNQLQNLDQNLQRLLIFNSTIDREIQEQVQTLVRTICLRQMKNRFFFFFCLKNTLHHRVDLDSEKLRETNFRTKHF